MRPLNKNLLLSQNCLLSLSQNSSLVQKNFPRRIGPEVNRASRFPNAWFLLHQTPSKPNQSKFHPNLVRIQHCFAVSDTVLRPRTNNFGACRATTLARWRGRLFNYHAEWSRGAGGLRLGGARLHREGLLGRPAKRPPALGPERARQLDFEKRRGRLVTRKRRRRRWRFQPPPCAR